MNAKTGFNKRGVEFGLLIKGAFEDLLDAEAAKPFAERATMQELRAEFEKAGVDFLGQLVRYRVKRDEAGGR